MLPPLPRCSSWAYSSLISPGRISLPRKGCRVGLHIVLFEACSAFTRVAACTLARSPIRDPLPEGFRHFVSSMPAPVASGWSESPGGACTHWKAPPCHGAHPKWTADAARAAGPPLLFGLRLWASACLALYVAFWLELDNAFWAGTTAAIVCQPHLGASLRKGWYRMIGAVVGAVAIVVLTACFPQDRPAFLLSLALCGAASALVATLSRNFAAYAAALAGYTAVIIASDQLGAVGGLNGDAFMLAVTRVSEIGIGIVSAGVVLAATDHGGARRVLARRFAALSAAIAARFTAALVRTGPETPDARKARRELIGDVVALDPIVDQTIGESFEIRKHSPALQAAVHGLFAALAGWRTVSVRLDRLVQRSPFGEVDAVLGAVPRELRTALGDDAPTRWMTAPDRQRRLFVTAARSLAALPAGTPSLRLLADQTARVLAGLAAA